MNAAGGRPTGQDRASAHPSAIEIRGLTMNYGPVVAVDGIDLAVAPGSVFGFLGQNGAGKTTTIRALMGLLAPTAGEVRVLGLDPRRDAVGICRRVGYMPERPEIYPWMTVAETFWFNAAFFPRWDAALAESLRRRLELPTDRRIRDLSRGTQAKVALAVALAPRPQMLILDDPTSGLDTLVRYELMEEIIANLQAEGGTVFFSTHLLHEVERVADEVAILHEGRMIARDDLESLKARVKKVRVLVDGDGPVDEQAVDGLLRVETQPHHAVLTVERFSAETPAHLQGNGLTVVEVVDLGLEEIFVELVRSRRRGKRAPSADPAMDIEEAVA